MIRKRIVKSLKWIVLFSVFAVLTVLSYLYEKYNAPRFRLTAGCGLIALLSIVASVWSLFDKNIGKISTMTIDDVFAVKKHGCVVVGRINGGMAVGERVIICRRFGGEIKTRINGMEIDQKSVKSAVNTAAALYFKKVSCDEIYKGDVVRYEA